MTVGANASNPARALPARIVIFIVAFIRGTSSRAMVHFSELLLPGGFGSRLLLIVFLNDLGLKTLLIHWKTERFAKLPGGLKREVDAHLPRLRIRLRIVNRDVELHVIRVGSMEAFDNVKRFTMGIARSVDPGLIVKAGRIHDELISIPTPDRKSHPQRIGVFRPLPPGHPDGAKGVDRFVEDHDPGRRLQKLDRIASDAVDVRHARWFATKSGIGTDGTLALHFHGVGVESCLPLPGHRSYFSLYAQPSSHPTKPEAGKITRAQ